jgi:hypothetical protein
MFAGPHIRENDMRIVGRNAAVAPGHVVEGVTVDESVCHFCRVRDDQLANLSEGVGVLSRMPARLFRARRRKMFRDPHKWEAFSTNKRKSMSRRSN